MKLNSISEVKDILMQHNKFLILTHSKPDGDALGSSYAILKYLHQNGKEAMVGLEEEIFYKYKSFFPPEDLERYFKFADSIQADQFDCIVILDTSSYNLLGQYKSLVLEHLDKTLIIDHHILKEEIQPQYYLQSVSSTCELIVDLIGIQNLDFHMAQALYMGIVFDTGQFRHSSTTEHVFRIVADIVSQNPINLEDIYYHLFENESIARKKLIAALVNEIEFFADGKIAVSYLSQNIIDDLKKKSVDLVEDDMIDLVVVPHSIKGVEVSVMIREKKDNTTFSFRSRCPFNVAEFASQFGGGGHAKAAGLRINKESYSNVKKKIILPLERAYLTCDFF